MRRLVLCDAHIHLLLLLLLLVVLLLLLLLLFLQGLDLRAHQSELVPASLDGLSHVLQES